MKIIVDYRERPSGIIRELAKHDIYPEEKNLAIGDFIIQTKDQANNIINLCIEKKTQEDFLNSIMDKRLIRQLFDMKEQFQHQLLVIEGNSNLYSLRKFHPNAIRGTLAAIAIDFKIPIITTRSISDTASLIATIAKRLERPPRDISLMQKKRQPSPKEAQEFIIGTFPGIGTVLAKSLLQEFKTIKKIINAKEDKLRNVNKIGDKKAKELIRIINHEYS